MFSSKTLTALLLTLAPFPMAAKLRGSNATERNLQTSDEECYIGFAHGPRVYLNFVGPDANNLGQCEGDCNEDSDCEDGLVCFQRGPFEAVPGCVGGKSDGSSTAFCIRPDDVTTVKFCGLDAKNLGQCEGDCDEDSDCEDGLVCYQRDGSEEVPGCIGGQQDGSRTDYCVKPSDLPSDTTLTFKGWDANVLGHCEGDCNYDSDCEDDLVCYQREPFQDVPGCEGGRNDGSRIDYCVKPSDIPTLPPQEVDDGECDVNGPRMIIEFVGEEAKNLGKCQGDCDEDSDCEDGLVCYQRNPFERIPGCFGGRTDGSRTDYCVQPSDIDITALTFCGTSAKMLGQCEGDCDEDSDCEDGLICYQRDPFEEVPGCVGGTSDGSRTDYCVRPSALPSVNYVTATKNLGLCQGDCDEDSDCEDGLVCWQRDAYEDVPGCFGGASDGSRTDYCIRPY